MATAPRGLTDEAVRILKVKADNSHPAYRWPATWGPNFDWLPDQDHGNNLLLTTQLMLLQADGEAIRLLPAWPEGLGRAFQVARPAADDGRVRLSRREDRAAGGLAGVAAEGCDFAGGMKPRRGLTYQPRAERSAALGS